MQKSVFSHGDIKRANALHKEKQFALASARQYCNRHDPVRTASRRRSSHAPIAPTESSSMAAPFCLAGIGLSSTRSSYCSLVYRESQAHYIHRDGPASGPFSRTAVGQTVGDCLRLTAAFGLPVSHAEIATFGRTTALVIERLAVDRGWPLVPAAAGGLLSGAVCLPLRKYPGAAAGRVELLDLPKRQRCPFRGPGDSAEGADSLLADRRNACR